MIGHTHPLIPGLEYYPNFLAPDDQQALWEQLLEIPLHEGKYRNQFQYGYELDFKKRCLRPAPPFPAWLQTLPDAFVTLGLCLEPPNSCMMNNYQPGQGIVQHIDDTGLFGETILGVSLGSACTMDFHKGPIQASFMLQPGSLLRLSGEARYMWSHGIAERAVDMVGTQEVARGRRISLTFREAIETTLTDVR